MRSANLKFLKDLTEAPSPSGFEQPAATVFRDFVSKHADEVVTNVMGSVHAVLKGTGKGKNAGPSVMLAGHIDEVGMMVNWITPEGFIAFKAIGGVDAAVLPGMRCVPCPPRTAWPTGARSSSVRRAPAVCTAGSPPNIAGRIRPKSVLVSNRMRRGRPWKRAGSLRCAQS